MIRCPVGTCPTGVVNGRPSTIKDHVTIASVRLIVTGSVV